MQPISDRQSLEKYWRVKQVAEARQCSERHVRRLIKDGKIKAEYFGRLVRIADSEARKQW